MKTLDWIRASQAILFEASIVPAFVGTAAAVGAGASFEPFRFGLILVSLVGIQAGANLFKGFYEGQDRSAPPSSEGSWFAFDSAAATKLTRDPRTVLLVGYACFGLGALAGLGLVVLTRNPLLLAFGLAGAFLAWSYSSPPLKLSYRGIGEIATFLAFGPIMTVAATVALLILVIRPYPEKLGPSERYDVTIALTIAYHVFAGVGLGLNCILALPARWGRHQVCRRHGHAEKEHRLDRRRSRRNMSRILP